jgi:hypothetical protein
VRAIAAAAATAQRRTVSTDTRNAPSVRYAGKGSGRTDTGQSPLRVRGYAAPSFAGVAPVYNLEVEGEHEYFANSILVHNCVWALTELAGGTDGWAGFVRSEAKDAAAEGRIPSVPTSRTNVEGGNRDICECGSAIWRGEVCFKCGKPRPTV